MQLSIYFWRICMESSESIGAWETTIAFIGRCRMSKAPLHGSIARLLLIGMLLEQAMMIVLVASAAAA